jgi:hypothetical protein
LTSATLGAQERGPATPEERATAVKLARQLEAEPLGAAAKDARRWLTTWLVAVPDISVSLCSDLLGAAPRSAKKYSSEMLMQTAYSGVAFIVENPEQANDRVAVYQAGVEGALKTYAAIRAQEPKVAWPFLDDLLKRQERGELREYVVSAAQKCAARK